MIIGVKIPLFGLMAALVLALSHAEVKNCTSSCGNISIRAPFRIKGDPRKCGDHRHELACENNRTVFYLPSGRYYVQEISYDNNTLRVVDASLDPDKCSVPSELIIGDGCEYYPIHYSIYSYVDVFYFNCTTPLNASLYVDVSPCTNNSSSPHMYLLYGYIHSSDFPKSCSIEVQVPVRYSNITSPTVFDIHKQLLTGFELRWGFELRLGGSCAISLRERFLDVLRKFLRFWIYLCYDLFYGYWHHTRFYGNNTELAFMRTTELCFLGRTTLGIFCLITIVVYKFRRRHLSMDHVIEEFLQSQNNLMPIRYSYSDIKRMTNGFKNKLGEGGFGCVFKGKLRSGHLVAIKLLGKSKANGQDFINEVATIGRIHHVNVVRLAGFCVEGSKQALVYEFMPNGSLDKFIFSEAGNSIPLSWEKLYEIALGVARGIEYLHRGCEMQILHFDIKPHNILLDDNFNPKVSDFGLAKLYPVEDSIVSLTAARGTLGYIAPELFYNNIGGISYKADVYSFGMLLLEMVGRRKNLNAFAEQSSQIYFPSWIYDRFAQGENIELADATDGEEKVVRKMIIVAFWCIQMNPINRPSMRKVLEMLESEVELQEMPPKPFVNPREMSIENNATNSLAEESIISINSKNEM